ncbi:hypothetical protein M3Y94_00877600 [Aphelenchoides besseyi]|nr:hypothetical protein M3Y94_00877600 [Aphelenchoides besseyi]
MASNNDPPHNLSDDQSPIQRPIVFLDDAVHESPNQEKLMNWKPRKRTVGIDETNEVLRTPPPRILEDVHNIEDGNNSRSSVFSSPIDFTTPRAQRTPTTRDLRNGETTLTPSRFDFNSPLKNPTDESFQIIEKLKRDSLEMRAKLNEMQKEQILDFNQQEEYQSSFQQVREEQLEQQKSVQTSTRQEAAQPTTTAAPRCTEFNFHSSFHATISAKQTTTYTGTSSIDLALRECISILNLVYKLRLCLLDIQGQHLRKINPLNYDAKKDDEEKKKLVNEFKEHKHLMKQRIRKSKVTEKLFIELKSKRSAYKSEADRLFVECQNAEMLLTKLPDQSTLDQSVQTTARLRSIPEIMSSSFNSPPLNQRPSIPIQSNSQSEPANTSASSEAQKIPQSSEPVNEAEPSVHSTGSQNQKSNAIAVSESAHNSQLNLIGNKESESKELVPPLDLSLLEDNLPLKPLVDVESTKQSSGLSSSRKRKLVDDKEQIIEPKSVRSSNRDTENDVTSILTDPEIKSVAQSDEPKNTNQPLISPQNTGSGFSTLRSDVPISSELQELPNSIAEEVVTPIESLEEIKSAKLSSAKSSSYSKPTNGGDAKEKPTSRSSSVQQSERQSESIAESISSTVVPSKSETPTSTSDSAKRKGSKLPIRIVRTPIASARSRASSTTAPSISELIEAAKDLSQRSISIQDVSEANASVASDRSGRRSPADRFRANFPLTYDEWHARESLPHSSEEIKKHAAKDDVDHSSVEANKLTKDLSHLSLRQAEKTEQTTEIKSDELTLFDVTYVDYLDLIDSRIRKQHKADQLVRNTMKNIVKYYWHRNLKKLVNSGLKLNTLKELHQIEFRYDNQQLRLVDEEIRVLINQIHDFVLGRFQFLLQAAIVVFPRDLASAEFRKQPTCAKLIELIDMEMGLYSSFYCVNKTVPMSNQMNRFEQRTNTVDLSRRRAVDHTLLSHMVSSALKKLEQEGQ